MQLSSYLVYSRNAKSGDLGETFLAIFPQSVLILSQNGVFMLSEAENISMLIHTLLACLEITYIGLLGPHANSISVCNSLAGLWLSHQLPDKICRSLLSDLPHGVGVGVGLIQKANTNHRCHQHVCTVNSLNEPTSFSKFAIFSQTRKHVGRLKFDLNIPLKQNEISNKKAFFDFLAKSRSKWN